MVCNLEGYFNFLMHNNKKFGEIHSKKKHAFIAIDAERA